jgi:tetratricopeptide (TPR) repeat protein
MELVIAIVAIPLTIGVAVLIFFLQKSNSKKNRIASEAEHSLLNEGIKKIVENQTGFSQEQSKMSVYLDGLLDVKVRRMLNLLNEGISAMDNYHYEKAILSFQHGFRLAKNDGEKCALLNLIGVNQIKWGKIKDAEKTFFNLIDIARKAEIKEAYSVGLSSIGGAYYSQGEFEKALEFYEQALSIDQELENMESQAMDLGNLGNVFKQLGEVAKALEYLDKAYAINRKTNNLEGQARDLNNKGVIYMNKGEYSKALECYDKALGIAETIGDLGFKAKQLINKGNIHQVQMDYEKALELYDSANDLFKKTKDKIGQAHILSLIGIHYQDYLKMYEKALSFHTQALEIERNGGNLEGVARNLGNIAINLEHLGRDQEALESYKEALKINEQIGRVKGQIHQLINLGGYYLTHNEFNKAEDFLERALVLSQEIDNPELQASVYNNLGHLAWEKDDLDNMLIFVKKARVLFVKLKLKEGIRNCDDNIAMVRKENERRREKKYLP